MNERQSDGSIRTLTQTAICDNRQQVIDWYGLTQPDIVSYDIQELWANTITTGSRWMVKGE